MQCTANATSTRITGAPMVKVWVSAHVTTSNASNIPTAHRNQLVRLRRRSYRWSRSIDPPSRRPNCLAKAPSQKTAIGNVMPITKTDFGTAGQVRALPRRFHGGAFRILTSTERGVGKPGRREAEQKKWPLVGASWTQGEG